MLKQTNMKQSEYGFAQTLLITAVIAAIAVIGYLMWDRSQNQYVTPSVQITTQQNQPIRQAPEPEKDNINTIEADLNKIDTTQYENQIDLGLTQLGTEISAF